MGSCSSPPTANDPARRITVLVTEEGASTTISLILGPTLARAKGLHTPWKALW